MEERLLPIRGGLTLRVRDANEHPDMPRKIRQLIADLRQAGFMLVPGGKGSHRKFRHARLPGAVVLTGQDGDDAHHYQERQVRNAVREANQ